MDVFNLRDAQNERLIVGKISQKRNRVVWKIPEFFRFPNPSTVYSKEFHMAKRSWKLSASLEDHLLIGVRKVTGKISDFKVRLGITGKDTEITSFGVLSTEGKGTFTLMSSSEFHNNIHDESSWHYQWMPGGTLNVFFIIETLSLVGEQKSSTETITDIMKLQHDLEFLLKGNVSNLIVNVGTKEFKLHRCILAARSPVFLAMLTHDTKENATGIVNIDDSDPTVFSDFLHYIYTGSMNNVSTENVMELYVIGDKYEVTELKHNCVQYMLENISIENFCDVLSLSLRHDEKELLEACKNMFKQDLNSLEIIKTSKWQVLMVDNPVTCNELFIMFLELKK